MAELSLQEKKDTIALLNKEFDKEYKKILLLRKAYKENQSSTEQDRIDIKDKGLKIYFDIVRPRNKLIKEINE